jgi:glycosyltransferase involved in cell wall biosynthesis
VKQFLGKSHSWSVTGWGLAGALKQNHDVHLFSTNGLEYFPKHLRPNLIGYVNEDKPLEVFGRLPDKEYDMQISFTTMKNFGHYLKSGNKNRMGIWSFEWSGKNILPTGWAKHHIYCDHLITHSQFAKKVFLDSGIPEDKVKVIPLGIDAEQYRGTSTIQLPTKKKFKILANIAQTHLRKNIPGLLTSFARSFTIDDDVVLILKAKHKEPKLQFEVSLNQCLSDINKQYPRHAEIKIYNEFLDDISALYRSVDCIFTMSHAECFYMPGIEALASGKINIAPQACSQIDYLNDDNALLIDGKDERARPESMYWESKPNAIWFQPDIDDAIDKLRYAYQNYEALNKKLEGQREMILTKYSWQTIAGQMMELCV